MNTSRLSVFPAVTLLLLLAAPSHAKQAGSVIFVKGTVMAERAAPVSLAKGDDVLVDDTISTAAAARAQLLMLDGAKIA
ncbi:MAG: hypothetical protein IIB76_09765, partial [Proteobacteria bacterium]|nr:hypothetical protein [Pseudomonadota bacterium]